MTPFERAQAEYHGFDNLGGTATRDLADTDYTPMLDPGFWRIQ